MSDTLRPPVMPQGRESFDDVVLPHLDAAYRLARWLMRNEHDAEDVVQEASLRALRYFRTFTGGNGRAWFFRIVRNTCRDWHARPLQACTEPFDEGQHNGTSPALDPEALLLRTDGVTLITRTMSDLPDRSRELLVRRELEGLSYQELADDGHPHGYGHVRPFSRPSRLTRRVAQAADTSQQPRPRESEAETGVN